MQELFGERKCPYRGALIHVLRMIVQPMVMHYVHTSTDSEAKTSSSCLFDIHHFPLISVTMLLTLLRCPIFTLCIQCYNNE